MGSGYSKMKKQAKLMEQQLEMMRTEAKNKKITGMSGNGLVIVVMNGEKELLEIKIKPECVDTSDLEGLQDLIKAACDDAYRQLSNDDPMSNLSLPGGMSLPFGF
jgi:nucleoid-associated protein EbfC